MRKKLISTDTAVEAVDLDRRSALSRLGLAVSVAYTAPILMTLSQSAHASDGGGGSGGGSGGSGVLVVKDEESGDWSQPAFYIVGSVSFGFQFGGQASEVIILGKTKGGIEKLYTSSFKLGGDASIAAGPYGAGVEGATSANLNADFLSFSRAKGIFADISLEGAIIKTDNDANSAYYNKDVDALDILVKKTVSNTHADSLRAAVAQAVQ